MCVLDLYHLFYKPPLFKVTNFIPDFSSYDLWFVMVSKMVPYYVLFRISCTFMTGKETRHIILTFSNISTIH